MPLEPHPSPGLPWGRLAPFLGAMPDPVHSLYVHVPFCAHKCEYCAFYSGPPSGDVVNRYVEALVRELELVAPRCRPVTTFFGGGTPSLLTLRQWETLLGAMDRHGLLGAAEWTVECNPATVSADKARLLRDHGVNRISMGVQSLDEGLLDRLGRVHSREMVFRSLDTLRAAGFTSVNLDLMFAIPTQTLETWRRTLDETIALGPEHLSCYEVIYEEDTPLFQQLRAGEFDVDEDLACSMYDELIGRAGAAGFEQYEIANFARRHRPDGTADAVPPPLADWQRSHAPGLDLPRFACRHNVAYWRGLDCFGLGPSASEYVDGVRSRNWANTGLYCDQLARGHRAREFSERLEPEARAGELAAFGLRMNAGWTFDAFRDRTGFDLRDGWRDDLDELVRRGWGEETREGFRLTRSGRRFADSAGGRMLRPTPAGARLRPALQG